MHRSIRLHTTVLVRFRIARCDVLVELYAHAANTRGYDIFGHCFHFEAFSNVFDRPHL